MKIDRLLKFVNAYVATMLWAETDGELPPDKNYTVHNLSPFAILRIIRDCGEFTQDAEKYVEAANKTDEEIAHDFWLTRNGHGAGFWDEDYEEEVGKHLTAVARLCGPCSPYVEDDVIYIA